MTVPLSSSAPPTDRLEQDRGYATDVLVENSVNTIEHEEFTDFQAGVGSVRERSAPYIINPLREVQNVKPLLYVSREADGSDIVDVLLAYEKAEGQRV